MKQRFFSSIFVFFSALFAKTALAALENPLGEVSTVPQLLNKIIDALILIGAPIASIMMLYAAFQMLFAGGKPEKFAMGRKTLLYTVTGYGILLLAKGVALVIEDVLR